MDNLKPIKTFLKELITPIVADAVKQAIPQDNDKRGNKIPVAKVTELYGISQSTIYLRFKTGQLTKHKLDGLTFVDPDELERTMKVVKLCDRVPKK